MSFRRENLDAQTLFRTAALENGYSPIPNHDKRCFVKGWNALEATPALIEEWDRKLVYQATGLRVVDGLCAIDVDIDDADLVAKIWDRAAGQFPQLREALIRYGSGAKEMWLCRTDDPFSVIFSTQHVREGDDPEDTDATSYRLEAFGGGHPRQIGASGAHTMRADNNGFKVEYTWDDDVSPAEVRLDALPMLPKATVLAIAGIASEEMAAANWPRVLKSRSGESDTTTSYDLLPDMRFDCLDGVTRSLDQLKDYATADRNPRCSAAWMGDPQFRNRTRCLIGVDHDGEISVLETANWTRHKPAAAAEKDRSLADKLTDLGDRMKAKGFEFDDETYHDAPASFQDVVFKLLEEWAWSGPHSTPCLPIYRPEELGMGLQNLRLTWLQYSYEREGPKGGVQKINPVDAWIGHAQRQDVDGYRFMPDRGRGVSVNADGESAINSYSAPRHELVEDAGERGLYVDLWEDFMAHLLPTETEREWFLDWLAHKSQNLTTPGVGVIMYAPDFGVGRGTLFDIIGGVFGERYVSSVTGDILMNNSTQGQYTDWLANALFVTTDEVLPDGDEGSTMAWRRKKAYEKLKERIDPKPRRTDIIRKGLPNYQDWVYASFLLATNHGNAIPIPKGDRRLTVLTNNDTPLARRTDGLLARIDAQRTPMVNPRFISVVADWLAERDVTGFNAHVAPDFEGKMQMQEANVTELEAVIDNVIDDFPHDWITLRAALLRIENTLVRLDLKDDYPNWRRSATDRVKSVWKHHGRPALRAGDHYERLMVYVRNAEAGRAFEAMDPDQRAEEMKEALDLSRKPSAKLRGLRAKLRTV